MIKWGHQDNVPISESLTLITPMTSLLPVRQHVRSLPGFGGAACRPRPDTSLPPSALVVPHSVAQLTPGSLWASFLLF